MKVGNNKKIDFKIVKRLFSYVSRYKFRIFTVFVFILISSSVTAISSLFLQSLIDDYISPLLLESNPDFKGLLKAVLVMSAVYLVGASSTLIYNVIMSSVSQGILKKIRDDMFSHMQTLPIKYFDSHSHGDIMSCYTNDTDTLRQMISQSLPNLFSCLITVTALLISMIYISVWMSVIVVLFVFVLLKIISSPIKKSGEYFVKQQNDLGDINGYIEEMINGQKVVKVFCHEEKAVEKFKVKNDTLCLSGTKANSCANSIMAVMMHIGYVLYFILTIVGGWMAIEKIPNLCLTGTNVLTLGMIASFLQLSINFINPVSRIAQQFNSVTMALAGAKRIFDFMDEKSEEDSGTVELVYAENKHGKLTETKNPTDLWAWKIPKPDGSFAYKNLEGHVIFSHVDFGYEPEKTVLHDINLTALPGQKIAFVGGTGAGKTTITNLINRFYNINNGSIVYDGMNIEKIKKSDLRRSIGVVLQDVKLFTGTVMENIRYGKTYASDKECIEASKLVGAHGFINLLPQKYQTIISGSESNLSQGQRQLISIARAAVANPPVMILDEATSSVDTVTEMMIQKGMDALMKGRTVFVIAHRLSTVQNSDKIIVLKQGHIVEEGTHSELINQKGEYYQLYTGTFSNK